MFRSILVPLDGSTHSEQALGIAAWIAQRTGAGLRLCHVRETADPEFASFGIEDEAAILSHLEEYLGVLSRQLARQLGRDVAHEVAEGAPITELIGVARKAAADLIVLTTHGLGGPAAAWLGGTAEGLARQAGTPLLLVRVSSRGDPPEPAIGHVLVPLDGSVTAEAALGAAVDLARLAAATLTLLAVVELPVRLPSRAGSEPIRLSGVPDPGIWHERACEYLEGVAGRLRAQHLSVAVEVRDAVSPASAILQAAADLEADAIAMTTHGRSRLRRMAVGSVSDKVIRASGVPVVLVPSREIEPGRPWQRRARAAVPG